MAGKILQALFCLLGVLTGHTFARMCEKTYDSRTGLQCYPCQPGFEKVKDCVENATQAECVTCKEGFYQPQCSGVEEGQCRLCSECFIYQQHCNATHNAICTDKETEAHSMPTTTVATKPMTSVSVATTLPPTGAGGGAKSTTKILVYTLGIFVIVVMIVVVIMIRRNCNHGRVFTNTLAKTTYENQLPDNDTTQGVNDIQQENHEFKDATQTNVDWFKVFKDIVPMLPIDEYSWKFFAFELFHICQERCGLPKDIHNEVKKIEHCNKNIALAYYEVFHTWYRLMASDAELDHIEKSLQRFENGFIMQEFKLIKSNPPVRNQCPRQVDSTVTLWDRPDMQHSSSLVDYMQQGSLYEREETQRYRLHHMREQQFIQFTNVSDAAAPLEISKTTLHRSSIPRLKERQFKGCRSYQKLNDSYSKRNNKVWQEKRKVKKNIKTAVKMRHLLEQNDTLKNENITLIKKILPYGTIPVSRQEYNTFLDHTVHVVMEHNNVTKRTVLSLAYKAYDGIAETNNGDRFVLHNGTTNMKLDKEQYECLDFYVKHARTRVLRELMELGEHGDTSFLFITYDGKSALQTYQRKQSVLRKTTTTSRPIDAADISTYVGGDFSPPSAGSETGDTEFDNTVPNKTITMANTSYARKQWNEHHTNLDENKFHSSNKQNLSAISTGKQNPSAISTGKQNPSAISTGKQNSSAISTGIQNASAISTGIQNPSAISTGIQNPSAIYTGIQNPSAISTGIQNPSAIYTGIQNPSAISAGIQNPIPTGIQNPSAISTGIQNPSAISSGIQFPSAISTGKQNSSLTQKYTESETLEYEYCVDYNQKGAFTEVAVAKRLSDIEHFKEENETAAQSKQLCENEDFLEMSACLASKHENVAQQIEGIGENGNKYSNLEEPLEDFLKEIDIELECSTFV